VSLPELRAAAGQRQDERALAARLRGSRAAARLSQDEVAARLGYVRSVVSAIENGKRKVTGLELRRLASIYQVSAGYLLGEEAAVAEHAREELLRIFARLGERDRGLVLRYATFVAAHTREEASESADQSRE
jgi:transcriptional regulator with XRE-family HTH domain